MNLDDTPGGAEDVRGFRIEAAKTRYNIGAKVNQSVGEELISNFKGRWQAGGASFL